jgi:hypothetical protein
MWSLLEPCSTLSVATVATTVASYYSKTVTLMRENISWIKEKYIKIVFIMNFY